MDWAKLLTSLVAFPTVIRVLIPGALTAWLARPFACGLDPAAFFGVTGDEPALRIVVLVGLW